MIERNMTPILEEYESINRIYCILFFVVCRDKITSRMLDFKSITIMVYPAGDIVKSL